MFTPTSIRFPVTRTLNKSFAELDRITLDFGKKNGANADALQACIKKQPDDRIESFHERS